MTETKIENALIRIENVSGQPCDPFEAPCRGMQNDNFWVLDLVEYCPMSVDEFVSKAQAVIKRHANTFDLMRANGHPAFLHAAIQFGALPCQFSPEFLEDLSSRGITLEVCESP